MHLSGFTRLEGLILRDTAITDKGLRHLSELKKLQLLDVGGTKVTSRGADELERNLPTLKAVVGIEEAVGPSSAIHTSTRRRSKTYRRTPRAP